MICDVAKSCSDGMKFSETEFKRKFLILEKYLVSCLLGFLSFGVHLAVLSFSCATEGPTSVIPQWQKGKCESESTLGDTRRGYSVNCTPARLTLLREECRRGFACMIRFVAAINISHRMRKEEAAITLLHGEDLFRIG